MVAAAAAAASETSAAAQLLVNAMSPTSISVGTPSHNNSGAVRQITPSTPIVLSAEALTSLLMMNSASQQPQQAPSVELSTQQLLQYVAEQTGVGVTLSSMDSAGTTELNAGGSTGTVAVEQMSTDLEVGATEMVLDEATSNSQKQQHPLHLN